MSASLPLHHIREIAEKLHIPEQRLDYYGRYVAKVDLSLIEELESQPDGKMILVTAMTPTAHGEGKTVTSIGLAQALEEIGKRAVATLREPSLGPVFGMKGGATGGGLSQVHPAEEINLHFTGDLHAITSAHNLLAAMIDSHIFHGNELRIDPDSITWPRAMDMNDRGLRRIISGLGGRTNGQPREAGFVITAASEVMAILALATSYEDLRERLSNIVIGFDLDKKPVRAVQLGCVGSMMVLLKNALKPNLVQTTEGTPAFVHAGPFANIAHGTSSVVSQRLALKLAEYVVNETGFAADLGAEKYFDIVMRTSAIKPSVAVCIATVKALRAHGSNNGAVRFDSAEALMNGFANLEKHLENLAKYQIPVVVSINRFAGDTEDELQTIRNFCEASKIPCAVADFFNAGGEGGIELALKVVAAGNESLNVVHPLYALDAPLTTKIETVAREIYGANGVYLETTAKKKLAQFEKLGFGRFPVCIAKTQSSLSDDAKLLGAPSGWTLTVTDARLSAGAGFVVVIAGNMMLMPGLPKNAQALEIDFTPEAEVVGLR